MWDIWSIFFFFKLGKDDQKNSYKRHDFETADKKSLS